MGVCCVVSLAFMYSRDSLAAMVKMLSYCYASWTASYNARICNIETLETARKKRFCIIDHWLGDPVIDDVYRRERQSLTLRITSTQW